MRVLSDRFRMRVHTMHDQNRFVTKPVVGVFDLASNVSEGDDPLVNRNSF